MSRELINMKAKLVETEDLLEFLIKYQVPISYGGYNYLFNELRSLRLEYAEAEHKARKDNHRMITFN
jgi:hypothetical protein